MKNRFKIASGIPWKTAALTLFCTTLFSGCQKDFDPGSGEERQTIQLTFSVEDAFETGTDYIPMKNATRAQTNKITMGNQYQYFILEETSGGDYLLVDGSNDAYFDPTKTWFQNIQIESGVIYTNTVAALRPGKYKIIIFTSPFYVNVNLFNVGELIPGPNNITDPVPFAVKYKKYFSFYVLPTEIFYAQQDFTVTKSSDLHTPNPVAIHATLTRRSSKFRHVFQETSNADQLSGTPTFESFWEIYNSDGTVTDELHKANPSDGPFPWGLDIWGRLWYDPSPPLNENNGHEWLDCFTYFMKASATSTYDGRSYFLSDHRTSIGANYYFSEPGKSIKVKSVMVDVVFNQWPPHAQYTGSHEFTLENNKITGMVLKASASQPSDHWEIRQLEPVYSSPGVLLDPALLFQGNYEHDF